VPAGQADEGGLADAGVTEDDERVGVPGGAGDELADRRFLAFTSDEHRTSSIQPGTGGAVSAP
jgi:hypothetical protein